MKWVPSIIAALTGSGVVGLLVWRGQYETAFWAAFIAIVAAGILAPEAA